MKELIIKTLEENKAEDIKLIDLRGKADFASDMIITSGRSSKHVCSVAQNLMDTLKEAKHLPISATGFETGNWVLIDAGDIIINVFTPESRSLYKLQELWG